MDTPLRLGQLVATLALAQDNAFGQPLESQLRSCLLATWICEAAGFAEETRETAYWVALLRYVGCTGHAHEVATVFGDEIAPRRWFTTPRIPPRSCGTCWPSRRLGTARTSETRSSA